MLDRGCWTEVVGRVGQRLLGVLDRGCWACWTEIVVHVEL